MDTRDLFERLGLALAIGLLIGLERGWRERDFADGGRAAGIRTFALIGLLGGLWGAMTPTLGPVPMAAAGLAFAAAFTLFEWRESVARKDYSVTTTIAGLTVFALGAFAVLGNRAVAGAAGVVMVGLLAARTSLHEFLKKLTWAELRSVVVLLTMTFVLLPVLPDMPIDPWDAINPYELWLLVVLIGAVSFAGYVAVRALGEQTGLVIGSAAGGIISSTTVTINYARLAAQAPGGQEMLSLAILIAWMVSLIRMTAIAVALYPPLFMLLGPPIGTALLVLGLGAVYFHRHAGRQKTPARRLFENPLDLRFVLQFGAALAAIIVATKLLRGAFGDAGVLALAGISGFVDVDPITLSTARLAGVSIMAMTAAEAILLAGAANMVTKMAATIVLGGFRFGWKLALIGVLALASGALALAAMGVR
ncbi:MAG: hypothetical protein QOF03_1752 [Alphaproteobacteria bacterium]|nr:hypothetical protein [Alphaproteobacteria bacterium]